MTKKKKPSLADDIAHGLKNAAAVLDGKPVKARAHSQERTARVYRNYVEVSFERVLGSSPDLKKAERKLWR